MANHPIFSFGDVFQLDSPLTPAEAVSKELYVEFVSATLKQGEYTLTFVVNPIELNPHNLRATIALINHSSRALIYNRSQILSNSQSTYTTDACLCAESTSH